MILNGLPWKRTDHSVVFEIASKYCILDSLVDHDGYSISSEGFLPAVVDIMVMPALSLAINLSFFPLLKLNQSNKQNFSKGKKSPTIMGWIYIDNTRLWQYKFKVSSVLETIRSYKGQTH